MPLMEFVIQRFNRETDSEPRWERYQVTTHPGMTVLEALHRIQEQQDASLAWRYSCRMGICGSCAMIINGKPGLACNTQVHDLNAPIVHVQPLSNFSVVKDLVPDLTPMFEKHSSLKTYLVRQDASKTEALEGELAQSPDELMRYLQFSHCTKCGACMAACPTVAIDSAFLGPMPLAAAHRYNVDSRDEGFEARKQKVSALHGAFSCHYAAECSSVCPKGVDPARAIQLMKRDLILDLLKLRQKSAPASLAPSPSAAKPSDDIPQAPEFTVKT
jgi:succinate dehydrogenase / fumarate reductase, iron-sulfur subunit